MSQRRASNKSQDALARGFTLIEVLISIAILSIGLLSVAALIGSTMNSGTTARYMNMANTLASEKLDMLNKWPSTDANVAPGGSLTGSATCNANEYCDQVTMSESSGANYETQTQSVTDPITGLTSLVTTTIVQTSSGCVNTPTACGVANPTGGSTFTRRWLITAPVTVTSAGGTTTTVGTAASGPRRITVVVTSNDQTVQPPISFQMSMVRP
ncbi:MAG TPA: prepilin-type N-terminal cleavage/methylation domain-containing protein [Terriglobales bacterium]|nr:prepilin-type N-terminal cleavage/methylation domain-containing protein [Terriglobales bacterium]